MVYDKQKVIDIALAEVGYLEKASNIIENKFHGHVEKQSLRVLAIELSEAGIKLNGEPLFPSAKMA